MPKHLFLTLPQTLINPDPGRHLGTLSAQKHPFETLGFSNIPDILELIRRPGALVSHNPGITVRDGNVHFWSGIKPEMA